ncbi:MAG: heme exporter protein CcmD [Arenimonas sp.]|jgi:heme exporter protein D
MKLDYVGGAYAVFALVLVWDYLAPRIKLAQVRRMIALRIRRDAAKANA